MINLGVVRPGSTLNIPFGSFAAATGAPSAVTNFADADIQVYKGAVAASSTTQRASAAGLTAATTFDALTGINWVTINLADNTTADFWNAGSDYVVVISDITVDGQTLRFPLARFTIGLAGAILDTTIATLSSQTSFTLTAGSADNSAYVGSVVYVHDVASAVQCAMGVVSAYTGATKTVTLAADPAIFTMAAGDNISILPRQNTHSWNGLPTVALPLVPTTAGRTLDVSATGEAGIDWANIGSPTTAQNLSATNIDVDQVVASVSGAVGSVTGNVGGNVTGSVGSVATGGIAAASFAAGAINAAAIAADAITDAKVAADVTIASVTGAVGSVTGNVAGSVGSVVGSVGSIQPGGIYSGTFNTGAIDAAALAASAGTELAAAVWDALTSGLTTANSIGKRLADDIDATITSRLASASYSAPLDAAGTRTAVGLASANLDTQLAAVQADTDNIQTRIPAALTSDGNIKADVLAVDGSTSGATHLRRGVIGTAIGTVGSASTTTSIVTSAITPSAAAADQFKGRILTFDKDTTTANLRGQATDITASSSGGVLTVTALTNAPVSGDTFTIT